MATWGAALPHPWRMVPLSTMQLAGTAGDVHLSRVMCHRTIRRDAAEAARRVCVTLVDPLGSVARPDEWETNMPIGPERLTVLGSAAPAYMAFQEPCGQEAIELGGKRGVLNRPGHRRRWYGRVRDCGG
jgi:hypothetical protein